MQLQGKPSVSGSCQLFRAMGPCPRSCLLLALCAIELGCMRAGFEPLRAVEGGDRDATAHCVDEVISADETDLDCCGSSCEACGDGRMCREDADCLSGVCATFICQQSSCQNGHLNQDELDVDCGGACAACPLWTWVDGSDHVEGLPDYGTVQRPRMALENRWRAPRITKELARLGIDVHEDTVRRYMPKVPPTDAQRESWRRFLRTHRDVIAAMDFFVVPTLTFDLLFGFVVIHHARRVVLHLNATFHPTAAWVVQQLREAFPYDEAPRYLILDNDKIFSSMVIDCLQSMGVKAKRTAFRSPWQNPVAERWIGSFRRELLDHVIVLGEQHLRRLGRC